MVSSSTNIGLSILFLVTNDIFHGPDGLREWRKKRCTKSKHFLLIECFKNIKNSQLTKRCVKCLDNCKKSKQQTKWKHGRQRSQCKDCGGSQICEHNRIKSTCKDCGGSQICKHNKSKSRCKGCGRSQICVYNKRRSGCKDCGGSQIYEHNKIRSTCKDCGGGQICEHNKKRSECPTCDLLGHHAGVVRSRVYIALKNDKEMSYT